MIKCPFCGEMIERESGEYQCWKCQQWVGLNDKGELVKSRPDSRQPWVEPHIK